MQSAPIPAPIPAAISDLQVIHESERPVELAILRLLAQYDPHQFIQQAAIVEHAMNATDRKRGNGMAALEFLATTGNIQQHPHGGPLFRVSDKGRQTLERSERQIQQRGAGKSNADSTDDEEREPQPAPVAESKGGRRAKSR